MKTLKHKANLPKFDVRASLKPGTWDDEKRTVEVVFATDTPYLRAPWFDETYYEILEMKEESIRWDRLRNGASLLNNHNQRSLSDVIGVVEQAGIRDGVGVALVRLSKRPELEGIVQDIKDGVIRNVSVGYMVHKFERQSPPTEGESEIPTYIAVDWEPMELSFVGVPADGGAQSRSESALQLREGEPTSECQLVIKTRGETMPDENTPAAEVPEVKPEVAAPAEVPQAEAPVAPEAEAEGEPAASSPETEGERGAAPAVNLEEIRAQEITRQAEIRNSVRAAKLEESFADKLVSDANVTVEAARAAVIAELEKKNKETQTKNNVRVEGAGMETQIARREAATRVLLNQFDSKQFKLQDGDGEMMAPSLLGMARKILQMEGVRGVLDMRPSEIAKRALMSTSDFPKILENIANKSLMKGYEQAPATFAPFVSEVSVDNFKDISVVELSDGGTLSPVNEHGEYSRTSLVENGEKYKVVKYGKIIGMTWELLQNDDLGAFTKVPQSLGMRARQKENEVFWGIITANANLADGQPLMGSAHGNLGTGGAISIASLGEGRKLVRLLKDLDGQPLNLAPKYLVVPAALETIADQFVSQITPNASGSVNPFANRLQVISEPRLDAASVTAWYLFNDAQTVDMVQMARLDGQGPQIFTREGFEIDGMETKVRYVFGMKAINYRGFFKNAGA